jgi:hypothetical protein
MGTPSLLLPQPGAKTLEWFVDWHGRNPIEFLVHLFLAIFQDR